MKQTCMAHTLKGQPTFDILRDIIMLYMVDKLKINYKYVQKSNLL